MHWRLRYRQVFVEKNTELEQAELIEQYRFFIQEYMRVFYLSIQTATVFGQISKHGYVLFLGHNKLLGHI